MRYSICLCLITLVTLTITGLAAGNENAKLAMHLIASSDSLVCGDLIPTDCDSINVDLSSKELSDTDGYGYVVFLAFDADSLSGAEFAVDGWPSGRGAPPKQGPYWCADSPLSLGDIFDDGGITAFGECVDSGVDGLVPLGYIFFGPLDEDDFPIDLFYEASTYSYPDSGHNYVLGCAPDFIEYGVASHSGCTIGGTYSDSLPDCPETEGGGGDGPEGGEEDSEFESGFIAEPLRLYADLPTGDTAVVHFQLENTADAAASYRLSATEDWITLPEAAGALSSDGEREIPVLIRAPAFPSGRYEAEIRLQSSDESASHGLAHVTMTTFRRSVWGYCGSVPNEYVEGQILFKVSPGVSDADAEAVLAEVGAVSIRDINRLRWGAAEVPAEVSQDDAMATIASSGLTEWVERNWVMYPRWEDAPDDSLYEFQWSLDHPGSFPSGCTAGADIDMPEAWQIERGDSSVLIAIVDSGIAMEDGELCNEDLDDTTRILVGWNFVTNDSNVADVSNTGHGTHVAGIAVAETDNSEGIAGVCPDCKAMIFKAFTRGGERSRCSLDAISSINAAVESGAQVINLSWGTYCSYIPQQWEDAVADADEADCILVNALANASERYWDGLPELLAIAGNEVGHTCGYDNVIPVGASDCNDTQAQFSSWGPMLGVVAPGGTGALGSYGDDDILSTDRGYDPPPCQSSYSHINGCSFAAPHVTGLVGLIRSLRPDLPAHVVRRIIFCSADQIDSTNYPYNEAGVCWDFEDTTTVESDTLRCWGEARLRNERYGYGRINAHRALQMADTLTAWYTSVESLEVSSSETPLTVKLTQNRPNPFNPMTEIRFYVSHKGRVQLQIYNVQGQRVRSLMDGRVDSGHHGVVWEGTDDSGRRVQSGIYFLHLRVGHAQQTIKLVLLE